MKLRQTISLILACMMAALQPSSIVYASDIENNITQESVEDVGSNTENVEDINESTEAVNENESVEISDDIQSNDIESSMEENTANQQNNGTVEDKITDDIFSDGSTGNNLSASEDYLSDLTVRDNENKEDNTNNEVKKILSADVILPNDQTDKVTVSLKNDFNEGDKLVVNYLEGEELDKCINGINDKKNANQDSKNNSNIEIDSILPLHMVITDANGSEIQGVENYEIKISEANTNSAEFFKNLKLFHQKQTGEWEEISWNTDNDVETGLTFIDWTTQNLGNFVFVKEKVQPVKDEEADVTVEDAKSVAISDKSGIEQEKADEKSDAKCTCDTNTDNAYKHAWNCPVFLEQLKKDCTCDSESEKVTSHNFECEAFKKAITEICTCETKDAPGMHDNCKVIRRMHDELCDCGRKYDSVDDIIDNHEKDSNIVTYLMKWADYANQPEIIATTYTIKYNLNGGSISGQKTKYTSTTATFTLPTPRRTGYTFTGWTGTGLSSATKTVTIKKGSKGNRTYTAHWSVNNYRFDINGWLDGQDMTYITGYGTMDVYLNGSMFANDVGDFCDNYPYGTTYTITDIKPTPGHTYNGVQSGSLSGTIGAGLTKVSLNFTSNHYRLTLNPNGGAFSDGSTGARALTGADLIYGHGNWNNLAGNPVTRYNCNFAGWYTAPSGGTKLYDANGSCLESSYWSNNQYYGTSDLTVYAQWSPYVHTVAYNANGGVGAPASQTKTYLVQLNLSTDKPTRTGYTFASWNTAADGSGTKWNPGDNYTPDYNGGTVTLYAQWTKDTYTISYNLNGGKISGQKTSYDVTTEAFTLPTPVRGGYTFSGWTGTGLSSATKTVTVAKGSAGNRSYTANWSAKIYTIYFDYNKPETDGTVGGAGTTSKSVRFDSTYGALPSPSLDGYTFDGWYTAASNGIKISSGTTYKTGGSTRLYAHWTLNTYSISYTLNGGSISGQPTSYNVNTATFTLPTPTKTGYTFTGWTGSNGTAAQKSVSVAKNSTGNKSYTASWSLNTYTISYNLNGGNLSGQKASYDVTTEAFTLPTPTKTGYAFTGWTGTGLSSATKTVTVAKGSTGNRSYTANWSANGYTVSFNYNKPTTDGAIGNAGTTNKAVTFDSTYGTLPAPTLNGYTFAGWYTAATNGTKVSDTTKYTTAGNSILYAQWKIIYYTINYDLNGGTASTDLSVAYGKYTVNSPTFTIPNPTKEGYVFSGWYGGDILLAPSQSGTNVTIKKGSTSNYNFKAIWNYEYYSIKYNLNGGTPQGTLEDFYYITKNVMIPPLIKSGYTFIGWTGTDVENPMPVVYISEGSTGNRSYTANWSANNYTVSFNYNKPTTNGTIGNAGTTSKAVTFDSAYGTLPAPTLNGYMFAGWYTAASNGTKVSDTTKYATAGNSTLYAHWTLNTYSIGYNLNGGSISGQPTSYNVNTATFTLPVPTRAGYAFTGWTGTGLSSATKTVTVAKGSTGNRSYTANWSANKYTVSYNGNGGSGSMSQDTATYGESYTAKANSFSRPGYTFAGWNESADGKSSDWTSWIGKPWAWTYTRSITLYAQWTKNTYSISYNLNGGNVSGQKTSYDVTTEAFTLPTPTRNGYTFTGWTGTGLSSATKTVTVAKGSTGNRSYTANWSANVLTINYHNDGATGFKWSDDSKYDDITGKDIILTEKYSYDSEYGPVYGLPNTSRLYKIGYHYDGYWYLDKKNSSVKVSDQLKLPKTQDVANAFGKLTDFEKGNTTIDVYASLIPNVLTVNYYPNGATKIDKSNDEDGSDIIDIDSNVVYKTEEFKYDTEMRHYGLDDSRRFIRAGYHSENTYTVDSYDSKVSLNAGSGIYANTQDMAKTAGKLTDLENGNVTINIYAYWIPNTYVIKYNGNGSTSGSMTDSSCTYDTAFSLSKNTFSRKGYLFCGWNTQSDGKGTPYKDNESIKNLSSENEKTIILYAQWTPIKYTVKYDANGGTGEVPADTTHTFNEKGTIYPENALAKNAFTRKGYKFSGWNASRVKDGKIEWYYDNWNWYEEGKNPKSASKYVWTDGGDTHNASDVNGDILTMHAQWKANTLTINYHNDNGATWRQYPDDSTIDVSNKDIVQSETVTYDEKYKHYEFGLIDAGRLTKAGYHLNNGWKINSMDSKTIVPDTNGSMNSYENSGKGVADFLGVLTGFEKGDVTVDLYPDIAINTGTVHYYPNSNEAVAKAGYDQYITNGEFAGSLATTTSFDYKTTGGSGANTLTDVYTLFERKGYHQSAAQNWHYGSPDSDVYFHCDEEDLSPYVKDATDVHLKLYANWISNDYTVKFDGNGSTSGNMADVTCKYDKSFNLTENKFIRNNYEFIGWNTKKDGSGQDYKDKESVKNLTDEDNGTVTLYAQWKLKEYTLTVSHTISGNIGNRDKDFSFTMSLSNSNKDAVIPENIEAVFMDDIGNKSKKLFTVVDEKVTFTLSHKESLIFKDIPYGTLYTISEDNENEYDVTNESASGTITKNIEVSFVSTKNGTVPTSSDTPNLYPIIMIAFAGIIYVILSQRKKKIKQKR